MRKVLVTGGSGKLGRYICAELAGSWDIRILDRVQETDFPTVLSDIRDLSTLERTAQGRDAIIHLAGIPSPRHASEDEIISTNVLGSWCVLQAALLSGVKRVIVCSSDFVTGLLHQPASVMPRYLPVDEAHPVFPREAYALSKHLIEQAAFAFARRGLEIIVLRPGLIVLPDMEKDALIAGERIDNPDLWWYAGPRDVAVAFRLALELEPLTAHTFFIGAPNTLSAVPTLELVQRRYGRLPEVRKPEVYRDDPHAALFDTSLAQRLLGFRHRDDWHTWTAGRAFP